MKSTYLSILAVTAVVAIVAAVCGCTGSTSTSNPTAAPTASSGDSGSGTVAPATGGSNKITVTDTASKVTITGGKGEKLTSDPFKLSGDGWYIVKTTYNGPAEVSNFIADVVTQADIDNDEAVAGLLPMMLESGTDTIIQTKGTYKSDDYKVYLEKADGPWTIEIQKSPAPQPSGRTSFSGKAADLTTVTPYFKLNQGSATFTVNQQLSGQYSTPAEVKLVNADTGELVAYVTHNDNKATITDTEDIPATGNYIMEVTCGGDWQISFTQ